MNKITTSVALNVFLVVSLMAVLGACTSVPEQQSPPEPAPVPVEPWDGDPMDIPMDGSSEEAFDNSVARVKAYATPKQYQTLVNAIDYLLLYDVGARGDKKKLIERLDGLTASEVIDKVHWRRPIPKSG